MLSTVMELPLTPESALAGLPFGTPRDAVRSFIGGHPREFRRWPEADDRPSDYWPDLGIFAYYDSADTLEALELAASAQPILAGHVLTSLPLQKAKELLRTFDTEIEIEEDGYQVTSKKLGVGLWSGEGPHGIVQAVMKFAPGYYDQ